MNQLHVTLHNQHFESSCYKTQQWKGAYRKSINYLKKVLKPYIKDQSFNNGHFYFSGFIKTIHDQVFYISISDVRYFKEGKILIRTAKNFKDYTGGSNNYISYLSDDFEYKLLSYINRHIYH
jgi:hypothetical protein